MKKKNKIINTVIASAAFLTGTLDANVVHAATASQVVNFAESTGKAKSKTITIPKLYKVNSVTTDNGDVSYTVSGNDITINVDNGTWKNREAYTDPKLYSKDVTQLKTQTTDDGGSSFPSTVSYNVDGYSGNLSKSGSMTTTGPVNTPDYTTGKVVATLNEFEQPKEVPTIEGYWTRTRVVSGVNRVRYVWFINEKRYSLGYYIEKTGNTTVVPTWLSLGGEFAPYGDTNDWWDAYYNKGMNNVFIWDYRGPGSDPTVNSSLEPAYITLWSWTKQVYTYKQNYSGTVYKSGTAYKNYTYEYNVTVNYETDTTGPTGSITASPTTATNGSVTLTATATDSQSGVKRIKLPSDTYVSGSTTTYNVTTNGTYTFEFEDNFGNVSSKSFTVSNIDKTDPSGTFSPNSASWTNANVTVAFNPSDTGGSGVQQWRYRTSTNNGSTYGSWSTYRTGDTTGNITLSAQGERKIQAEVTDNAGNINTVTSGTYEIDMTNPSGTLTANSGTSSNTDITFTFDPSDTGGSGVKQWRYHVSTDNGSTYNSWSTYRTGDTTGNIILNLQGKRKIEVEITDNAGNVNTVTSETYIIDKLLPDGTFTPNTTPWTKESVTVAFNPSDEGDSGVKQWRYRTSSNKGSTYGTWSSYILGDTDENIVLSSEGEWKIQAEVTDNAGNINYVTSGMKKGVQAVNFSENSSQTRSQTITIPNLAKVNFIATDTGNVSYTVDGDKVTINVSGGDWVNREAYTDPQMYSKDVTKTVTQTTDTGGNTFSSTISYSDGSGYSGTLAKNGAFRKTSTQNYSNYTTDKLIAVENEYEKPNWNPTPEGYWTRTGVVGGMTLVKSVWYYEVGRYSQGYYVKSTSNAATQAANWINAGGPLDAPRGDTYDWWDFYNNHGGSSYFAWNYTGPGTKNVDSSLVDVYITNWSWTRSVSNYEQDYSGTVYKSGTQYKNYTYAYNVTVNYETEEGTYEIDKTNPSGTFTPNSTPWTNSTVKVTFNPSDAGGSGLKEWRYRTSTNNGSTYGSWSTYRTGDTPGNITLSAEGERKIQAEVTDNAGNTAIVTSGTHNIDKTIPTATFNPNSVPWTNAAINVSVDPSDTGGSGVKQWRYRTSYNNGTDYGAWSSYKTGDTTGNVSITTQGQWKIEVEVTDNAENINTVSNSGTYDIDLTKPSGVFNPNNSPWTYIDIPVTFNPSDTGGSNVKQWRYRTSSDNGSTYGTWSSYTAGDTNGTIKLTSNGIWKIEAEVMDVAGNVMTVTSGVYYIDKSIPGATFNPNTVAWTNQDVTVTIDPYDTGKSGIKEWKYRTSKDNGSTWGNWSTLIVGDVSKTITFSTTGKHVIEVDIKTAAGVSETVRSGTYYVDKTKPNGILTASTTQWTNQNVILTATGSDSDSGMKQIKLPDGTIKAGSTATYTATVNGVYTFRFYDNTGNYTDVTYTVDNIERVKPFVWYESKSPETATKGNVTISVVAGDADSGVRKITLPNGTSVNSRQADYTVSVDGEYIFTVEDYAGNQQVYVSKVTNIDKDAPTISGLVLYEHEPNKYQVTVDAIDKKGIKIVKLNTGQNLTYNSNTSLYEITNLTTKPSSIEIVDKADNSTGNVTFMTAPTVTYPSDYSASNIMKDNVEIKISGANTVSYIKNGAELACTTQPCPYTFTNNGEVIAKHSLDYKAYLKNVKITNIDKKENDLVITGQRSNLNKFEVNLSWNLNILNPKVTCESSSDSVVKSAIGQSIKFNILNETYECWVEGTYQGHPVTSNKLTILQQYDEELVVDRSQVQYTEIKSDILIEKSRSGEFYLINAGRSNFNGYDVPVPSAIAD